MALILRPPGSQDALPDRLSELGRGRKRFAVATGIFQFVAVVAGSMALAGILDAALVLPPLFRGLALVAILATAGVLWLCGIASSLAMRTDPLTVALELEERYPSLNDALASAVEFLSNDAEGLGVSNRLQKVVVRSAQRLVDRHEFGRLIQSRPCWRWGWLSAIVLAALIPLVLVNISRAGLALVRLADPFGNHPWPTKTQIEILVPETLPARVPRGEPFDLKFVVRGVLKDRAYVEFRLNTGEEFQEPYPLAAGAESRSYATISARIDGGRLPSSFEFRIVSNDFDTGWQGVEVVPPPKLVDLEGRPSPQFHIAPPEYTGLPAVSLPDGAVALEIPAGTRVRMRAASDLRLSSAQLCFQGDKSALEKAAPLAWVGHFNPLSAASVVPLAQDIGSDIPLSLDGDGRVMSVSFVPAMSGKYVLKMKDETGLTGTRLIDIRLVPDPAPIVVLQRPSPGKDPTILTPSAVVPVRVSADDKLYALRTVFLEYRVGRQGRVQTIGLADASTFDRVFPALAGGLGSLARSRPTSAEIRLLLPIASLRRNDGSPVRDGDTIYLSSAADDWDDVTILKEPGRSGEVEIQIASIDEVEAWLQKEMAALRPDFLRMRETQREARQKTADAVPAPDGSLTPLDRDKLLTAEQLQRQIRGKATDPRDGLRSRLELLRDTVIANQLPRSNTTNRVEAVVEELLRIAERDLNPIETHLSDARQIGGQPAKSGQEHLVPDHLKKAARHQKAVEDGLTNLLDLLTIWGGAAELRGESRVLRDQINRHVEEGARLAEIVPPGKVAESLTAPQKAELERAGGKAELAAEHAASILARAARLAGEKDRQAIDLKEAAARKEGQAEALNAKAAALPQGSPEKNNLNAEATTLKGEADALKAAADKAAAEAAALRKGIEEAGGQQLPHDLRKASEALRNNRQAEGAGFQRSAAERLGKLIEALTEKAPETAPDLAKLKTLANEMNALADAQEELRKRASEAARIKDQARRDAELQRLVPEQEKLIERNKDLLQRLVRERAEQAARDARAALDHMEAARDELENGKPGTRSQDEAIDRLDTARDRLDSTTNNASQQLSEEKRRKMADRIQALLERQKAGAAEAERIHGLITKNKKWERPLLASYADLEERERVLAAEVRQLGEKEFAPLPVLARLLKESAGGMETAADRVKIRREDALDADPGAAFDPALEAANDRKVKKPLALATRRLEQLLEVLKEEPPRPNPKKGPEPEPKGPMNPKNPMPPTGGGNEDLIPPLAQLKVLRSLQAELNQRTEEFAREHPDKEKLTDEELTELKELEQAQREIATLFEQLAALFKEQEQPKDMPEKPEDKDPEKSK